MKNYLIKQIYRTALFPSLFILLLWIVHWVNVSMHMKLTVLGVAARELKGLPGIITSVLVHGGLEHIASNSIPLLVLGMMLFYFYKKIAFQCFGWIWVISGLWLWIGGHNGESRTVYHIGASTLIYGLATFLFFSGLFRRHKPLMVVSALVVFLYGSIMWGIFPLKAGMSWEGHLFGAIAGVMVAYNFRKEGPQRKVYEWENEEDDDDEPGSGDEDNDPDPGTPSTPFTYTFIPKDPFRS